MSLPSPGSVRISAAWYLPEVLREFGVDVGEVLDAAGVRADIFDDRDNVVTYPDFGRLLLACERRTRCDHIGLLIARHVGLAEFGLAGQIARCAESVGDGLQRFADHFNLHNSAAVVSVLTSGSFARFVYAITTGGMTGTGPLQLGAAVITFNILRELCGAGWRPTVITVACRAPANLLPCQRFFRAPLRFDSDQSAVVFERHWLDRPLHPVDPVVHRRVEAAVRARRAEILADVPATVRGIVRRQLIVGNCSMDDVAARLGMHRRSLDRHLKRHGIRYGELLDSVRTDAARQLLRDTDVPVQQIAESLRFSSAANFATAFRRWTGMPPSAYRRAASGLPAEPHGDQH
jgi:AraC-like DNA-binding protein